MPTCHAKSSRTGKPCKNPAIHGGAVCRNHGGSAPQVKAAAKLRLLELVDPALAAIARSLKPNAPAAVQLRAAEQVLDRVDLDLENKAEAQAREITVRFVNPGAK